MLAPGALPLDLGVHVALRMYASVFSARLESRPVRLVFDWICKVFGQANSWFADDLVLTPRPSVADEGMRIMFNLPADAPLTG
jgi:hypothetical protein